jgi:3-deoxy-D-manno-octulosonic-acid transferase
MLNGTELICAQTRTDAQRLRNLGVRDRRISVTGNLKFDVTVPGKLLQEAESLRADWGRDRQIWIAGSTHAGEERQLLDAYTHLKKRWPRLLLVLVPRHPERFAAVARLCRRRGWRTQTRSSTHGSLPQSTDVLVGDTMGELHRLYAASDVAFVGGSLVKRGG